MSQSTPGNFAVVQETVSQAGDAFGVVKDGNPGLRFGKRGKKTHGRTRQEKTRLRWERESFGSPIPKRRNRCRMGSIKRKNEDVVKRRLVFAERRIGVTLYYKVLDNINQVGYPDFATEKQEAQSQHDETNRCHYWHFCVHVFLLDDFGHVNFLPDAESGAGVVFAGGFDVGDGAGAEAAVGDVLHRGNEND